MRPEDDGCGRCAAPGAGLALDVPKGDATLAQVVGRHFERHRVTRQNTDVVLLHAAGRIGHQLVTILERDAKTRVRQHLGDGALHFDQFFLGQMGAPGDGVNGQRVRAPRLARKFLSNTGL